MVDLKKSLGALAYHISQTGTADKQDVETVRRAEARISDMERELAEARAAECTAAIRAEKAEADKARLVALVDTAVEALDYYGDPTGYLDNNGERLPADAENNPGLLAKETAANLRAALSAPDKAEDRDELTKDIREARGTENGMG